ncbi:MAG: DNA polymerase Y family protein [Spirochaetaceae bacterium]|nr:MAG: DNA polymerase Y family protein [Spirochaetaceae bacterium]
MVRPACLDIVRLPLQIVLNRNPEWKERPVAVVSEDAPLGAVLFTNRVAEQAGVQRGLRYAAALSICPALHGSVVGDTEIQNAIDSLVSLLQRFTPHVEECAFDPGALWLDAHGLEALYGSVSEWALTVRAAVRGQGYFSRICVGYSRFGSYAGAKRAVRGFQSSAEERRWVRGAPVSLLPLPTEVEQRLQQLGTTTVGEFCALPREGIRSRFGMQTDAVYRLATEPEVLPVQGADTPSALRAQMVLDSPLSSTTALLSAIEGLLLDLLSQTVATTQHMRRIELELDCEDGSCLREALQPATPSRDAAVWLRLLRLRFESVQTAAPVQRITVHVEAAAVNQPQSELFSTAPRRDRAAAARAFALLRARFGNNVVCRMVLQPEHRPDRRFVLMPLDQLQLPARIRPAGLHLVRRILDQPVELASRRGLRPAAGPFVVSGKWWEQEAERHYYYAWRGRQILWIYHDCDTNRWFIQGGVE